MQEVKRKRTTQGIGLKEEDYNNAKILKEKLSEGMNIPFSISMAVGYAIKVMLNNIDNKAKEAV